MACCPLFICPRWHSAVLGSITVLENGKVRIANNEFEKKNMFVDIDATPDVIQMFKDEKATHDYGIIVVKSKVKDGQTKEDAIVIAFVSFYRDDHKPESDVGKRQSAEKALHEYDRLFEEFFSNVSAT